ncbi:MAG: hypothetical protein ACT4OO_06505 [Nitrospiraceae bacterium]
MPSVVSPIRALVFVTLFIFASGCDQITKTFTFSKPPLPDLGPPIESSVKLKFDPSLTNAKAPYVNSCGRLQELMIGPTLEETVIQAAHLTFTTVSVDSGAKQDSKPDMNIRLRLLEPKLTINADAMYDRAPTELVLDSLIEFRDASGNVLAEEPLQVMHKERVRVAADQKRCEYLIDEFLTDAAANFSVQFSRLARRQHQARAGTSGPRVAGTTPGLAASSETHAKLSPLSFKATLLDENSNVILEGGEHIKVRVDLVNSGPQTTQGISVTIAGSPALVSQFPATTLPVGALQPGESRTVEFVTTLPATVQSQRAELQVTVSDASNGPGPASQTLTTSIRPSGVKSDDVDQIPVAAAGFNRPHTYVIAVGLSSYRDSHVQARKYAALDAEMVSAYLQSLGGIPAANVRLLQDWKALRGDIEEALLDWLPSRMSPESTVIVFFAGHAVVSPAGETFLVPYEGSPSSQSRLYPLKDLETALSRLRAQQTVFVFDGIVSKMAGDSPSVKNKPPRWDSPAGNVVRLIGTPGFGKGVESEKLRHGLFTYYFLRGLRGDADANRDGGITLGELAAFLTHKVTTAAKSLNQEQHPLVIPALRPSDKASDLILTKPATIQAAQLQ